MNQILSVRALSITLQQKRTCKQFLQRLPSTTGCEISCERTRKGKISLITPGFCLDTSQLQKTLHCPGQKEISNMRVTEHCWPPYVFFPFPFWSNQEKLKCKLVFYLHSHYFIPNTLFLKWNNYSSLKAVQNHLEKNVYIYCEVGSICQLPTSILPCTSRAFRYGAWENAII